MSFEPIRKSLLAELRMEQLSNKKERDFVINFKGDVVEAGRIAGFNGADSSVYSRVSRIKKKCPAVAEYMAKIVDILGKCRRETMDALAMEVDAGAIIHQLDVIKDEMDLSWCNYKQALFLTCYSGSKVEAARIAGYAEHAPIIEKEIRLHKAVNNMMRDKRMKKAIEFLDRSLEENVVLSSLRGKLLLTKFAEDEALDNRQRQAAITTLLKTKGAFVDKILVENHGTVQHEHTIRPVFKSLPPGAIGASLGLTESGVIDVEAEPVETLEDLL